MPLQCSYSPNYFSIDDILATQERAPCKFNCNVPKLGKLNTSSEEKDLKAGTNLELPMWLIHQLSMGRTPVVSADLPRTYKEGYREILNADASVVDLHKFGLYFFELGSYAKFLDPKGDVAKILIHTFKSRFLQLMDLTDNTSFDPTVLDRLDTLEKRLFSNGLRARSKLNLWLLQTDTQLEAANMVLNHKKRKRVHLEDLS